MSIHVTEKENLISISPIYIQSKYGSLQKSKLFIEKKEMNVESTLYWRKKPNLFVNFSSIKAITKYSDDNNHNSQNNHRSSNNNNNNINRSNSNDDMSFHTLSDDFFNDEEYKEIPKKPISQKLAFHFSNDFKLIIDFSSTEAMPPRPTSASSPVPFGSRLASTKKGDIDGNFSSPRPSNLEVDDEPVPGSDTTSDSEGEKDLERRRQLFYENSFEDLERDIENDTSKNIIDQVYTLDELLNFFNELHTKSVKIAHLEQSNNNSNNSNNNNNTNNNTGNNSNANSNNNNVSDIIIKQEQLLQLNYHFKTQESSIILNNFLIRYFFKMKSKYFFQWIDKIKIYHDEDMKKDRHRWRLHAAANQELDLQAWYHALFYQEVYRLRGHFWYKDAVLPGYKQSYDLVDNALTPLEEAALAHVLCSPDTSYGDVAGQMFIAQSVLPPHLFTLFQQLASQGAQIIKYPRQGRPAKKLFRFSFVDGNIYLTWKGKFGNQGVGMYEVTGISTGLQTDVLKWSGQSSKSDQYLSLLCADRSVDLLFDNETERNDWKELLTTLMTKEQGFLAGVEPIEPTSEFDAYILYSSIGKKIHR